MKKAVLRGKCSFPFNKFLVNPFLKILKIQSIHHEDTDLIGIILLSTNEIHAFIWNLYSSSVGTTWGVAKPKYYEEVDNIVNKIIKDEFSKDLCIIYICSKNTSNLPSEIWPCVQVSFQLWVKIGLEFVLEPSCMRRCSVSTAQLRYSSKKYQHQRMLDMTSFHR